MLSPSSSRYRHTPTPSSITDAAAKIYAYSFPIMPRDAAMALMPYHHADYADYYAMPLLLLMR